MFTERGNTEKFWTLETVGKRTAVGVTRVARVCVSNIGPNCARLVAQVTNWFFKNLRVNSNN